MSRNYVLREHEFDSLNNIKECANWVVAVHKFSREYRFFGDVTDKCSRHYDGYTEYMRIRQKAMRDLVEAVENNTFY